MVESSSDIRDLFVSGLRAIELSLAEERIAALINYYEQLRIWSKKINLIGKQQSAAQIIENHFIDSLLLLHAIEEENSLLADVGTGAGFPGLVCKVANPSMDLLLIEPRLKRVSFLRHMIRQLGLKGVAIKACRVEDAGGLGSCHYITSRAVAEIDLFVALVGSCINSKNKLLCMKGPRWKQELDAASQSLGQYGIELEKTLKFTLPATGAQRAILIFRGMR